MTTHHAAAYRELVREVNKASLNPRATRPKVVSQQIRAIFEQQVEQKPADKFYHDMRNTAMFMRSQRMHKALLERYNPLLGLSTEDRVKKTAHRVGLNMPISSKDE